MAAITKVVPEWCQEVVDSYADDEQIKELLERLMIEPNGAGNYTLTEGMLRFKGRLVIRSKGDLKRIILQYLHDSLVGGHSGIQNTYLRVKQLFYWPKMKTEVKNFVLACDLCKRCKLENVTYLGLLQPLPVPD